MRIIGKLKIVPYVLMGIQLLIYLNFEVQSTTVIDFFVYLLEEDTTTSQQSHIH